MGRNPEPARSLASCRPRRFQYRRNVRIGLIDGSAVGVGGRYGCLRDAILEIHPKAGRPDRAGAARAIRAAGVG
jgi:hypothetical protein